MTNEIDRLTLIGLRCGDVADAAFPHFLDRNRRDRFALALVELTRALASVDGRRMAETALAGSGRSPTSAVGEAETL